MAPYEGIDTLRGYWSCSNIAWGCYAIDGPMMEAQVDNGFWQCIKSMGIEWWAVMAVAMAFPVKDGRLRGLTYG